MMSQNLISNPSTNTLNMYNKIEIDIVYLKIYAKVFKLSNSVNKIN